MQRDEYEFSNLEERVMMTILENGNVAYGVEIHNAIEAETHKTASIPGIYIALDRLEKAGYVRSELAESTLQRGGRSKRYFTVTGLGKSELRRHFARAAQHQARLKVALDAYE
jgi:PadR family transcriptional regulator PadR